MDTAGKEIEVVSPGILSYGEGLKLQESLREKVNEGAPGFLVLLEHQPVITNGRFAGDQNFAAALELIKQRGVEVYKTDRGGDLTFHGPGQLVAYPIIPLRRYKLRPRDYIHLLEETLINTLGAFGIQAQRREGYPGVWVRDGGGILRLKIASIGVSVKNGVTSHGSALNVSTDLSYFSLIVPCGIPGIETTSMNKLLGKEPQLESVASTFSRIFIEILESGPGSIARYRSSEIRA